MEETKKVFISYSHKDRDTCNKIDSFLAKRGETLAAHVNELRAKADINIS